VQLKCGLSLPPSHPISSGNEIIEVQAEPAIDEEFSILLRHHNVTLLPQITHNLFDRRSRR
jgi:hypothetical protein